MKKIKIERGLRKIYTLLIALMPILNIYATKWINSLGVGEFLGIIILLVLCFWEHKYKIVIQNKYYWLFVLYLSLNSLILTVLIPDYLFSETIIRIFKTLFYTSIIFLFSYQYFDLQYFEKIYLQITFFASIYLLLQYFVYKLIGINLPTVLPNTNLLNIASSEEFKITLLRRYKYEYRPSGFFTEPSHFCQFVIYSVPIILTRSRKSMWHYIVLILTTIAILISGSAIGYVCLTVIISIWLISAKKMRTRFTIFVMAIVFAIISIKYGFLEKALYRFSTVKTIGASTGTLRLLRGFIVFNALPFGYKIFGIGAGNYAAFINAYNIVTMFDNTLERENEYMNTISMLFVYGGIVGAMLYIYALCQIIRKANRLQIMCFAILLLLIVSSNIFYTATYIMPMLLISNKINEEIMS